MTWPDSSAPLDHSYSSIDRERVKLRHSDHERPRAGWLHAPDETRERNGATDRQPERLTGPTELRRNRHVAATTPARPECFWPETQAWPRRCVHMEATVDLSPRVTLAAVADPPLLSLDSISKAWGAKVVLDDVTLALAPGTLTWLGGANGVGKTTLLRIAAGLLGPDSGQVTLDGLHPLRNRREYRRRLAFLSAGDRGIYARLTVHRHLHLWARLALMPDAEVDPAIEQIVQLVGLEELLPMRADRISMGQRQRLRLAMTFLHSPRLVLLDEPLSSLDEAGAETLRRCIDTVLERSGAVLWCSPGDDRGLAEFDRRVRLEQGRLLEVA